MDIYDKQAIKHFAFALLRILIIVVCLAIVSLSLKPVYKYEYIIYHNMQYDDENYVGSTVLDLDSEIHSYEDIVVVSDILEAEFRARFKATEDESVKVILMGFDFLSKKEIK